MILCKNCGKKAPDNAKECPYCHFPLEESVPAMDVQGTKIEEARNWRKADTYLFVALGSMVFSAFALFPVGAVFAGLAYKNTRFTHLRVAAICFAIFGLLFWTAFLLYLFRVF